MSKKDTVSLKMVSHGRTYEIDKYKYDRLETLFLSAKASMKSPCLFHFISHIDKPDSFRVTKKDLIRSFERALKRQYKPSSQPCPNTAIAYSIEFKNTTQKEIDGSADAYKVGSSVWQKTSNELPFLHIHFYVIADFTRETRPQSFPHWAKNALDDLNGLRATRYMKNIHGNMYHKLSDDDAFSRFLYIGKVEQKSSEIPYPRAFSTSKIS